MGTASLGPRIGAACGSLGRPGGSYFELFVLLLTLPRSSAAGAGTQRLDPNPKGFSGKEKPFFAGGERVFQKHSAARVPNAKMSAKRVF